MPGLSHPSYRDKRTGQTKRASKWYAWITENGRRERIPLCHDKTAAQAMLNQLLRDRDWQLAGITDADQAEPIYDDDRSGFVYLLASAGFYKIGKSIDPEVRRKALQVGIPGEIRLVHAIATDDMNWLETRLHRIFAAGRVRGEWFQLSDRQVSALCRITSYHRATGVVEHV